MLTRQDLAKRWATTPRTIDRRRKDGLLPWVDLAAGTGRKPQVRFMLADVEEFESRYRLRLTTGQNETIEGAGV
jgi:hypothetical protein